MHTLNTGKVAIHFNSDLSGEIIIEETAADGGEVRVTLEDIEAPFADSRRRRAIAQVTAMDDDAIREWLDE